MMNDSYVNLMNISDSRRLSYAVHDGLMDAYSKGLLIDHRFSNGRAYSSWPDSESILMSANAAQDTDRLGEFVARFTSETYTHNNIPSLKIKGAKISYPHKRLLPDIPPPHPDMSDEILLQYEWPNAAIIDSYSAVLYIDLGDENREFLPADEDGEFAGIVVENQQWVRLMNWPVMVGSNRCNMAVIRSYLDDPEYAERARYILEDLTHCEFTLPDGYFIIKGRIKKVNIIDRLQMNTPYTLSIDETSVIGNIICEIRSLERGTGISTHNVHLVASVDTRDTPPGSDSSIYKFYTAIAVITLERGSKASYNIFDVIASVGASMGDIDIKTSQSMLIDTISVMTRNDPAIMRVISLTYNKRREFRTIAEALQFGHKYIAPPNKSRGIEDTYLPHCRTFQSKVMMTSIMTVNVILVLLGRMEITDMKDFIYKRFDIVGHRMLDYLRSMLQRNHDISSINKDMNSLISVMGQNKWPSSYKAKRRKGLSRDENLATAIVNDIPLFNNASILDNVRMIKIGASNTGNTSASRRVHTSQYFYQCPANTPENENIGLNNALSEVVLASIDLTNDEREEVEEYIHNDEYKGGDILLIYDGCPLFYVKDSLYWDLVEARSTGSINQGIGIAIHDMWGMGMKVIVVRLSHGRPLAPLIRLPESMTVDELHDMEHMSWSELSESGRAIITDPYEMSFNMVVAPWIHDAIDHIDDDVIYFKKDYTHSAILPGDMLSQATNCLQYIEHDPAARGTYATLHIKQSISHPFLFPELRYDHEAASISNPEPPLISTRTARRIGMTDHESKYIPYSHRSKRGYGSTLNVAFNSDFGNYDDAINIAQSVIDRNLLGGYYYDIFTSDQNISITAGNTYNVMIAKRKNVRGEMEYMEVRDSNGIGLIDPDFSNSVITPYAHPNIIETEDIGDIIDIRDIDPRLTGHYMYQLEEGLLYVKYGFKKPMTYLYKNVATGEISEKTYVDVTMIELPGLTRIEGPKIGNTIHLMALSAIREDKLSNYDNTFISDKPFEWEGHKWYMSKSNMPMPKASSDFPDEGMTVAIMRRRQIKRGDAAIKLIERNKESIVGIRKEKFSVTFGIIERIQKGTIVKIRVAMPILPEPGNKYASLHAQKSVCARIIPDDQVPEARWTNPVTGEEEVMKIHIIFNSLALPSRMTMGMVYEQYFMGTLSYMRDKGMLDLYRNDRSEFDYVMENTFSFENAASFIDELTDATPFVYDNMAKKDRCMELREALGIPPDGMYDMYYVKDGEITSRISERIACGSIYYVALRHLVDNKRRARGYVGKRDPFTLQPVRGRRREGGSSFGTMEMDVLKVYGARTMLWERTNKVSDGKTVYKCDRCGGLVSRSGSGSNITYKCIDEEAILPVSQVTEVSSVVSWELFRYYTRALGMELTEHFSYQ